MSCILVPIPGGPGGSFPLSLPIMQDLIAAGGAAMAGELGIDLKALKPPLEQYVGFSRRPDGEPFYLTTLAPMSFDSIKKDTKTVEWSGAFYVPLGYGHVIGTVVSEAGSGTTAYFSVKAKLYVGSTETVAANWRVLGPDQSVPQRNLAALINRVEVTRPGPHDAADMRRCIALHAPAAAWGEPRGLVAQQCGVAVACLIEAIC